jgi:hypothetical protein
MSITPPGSASNDRAGSNGGAASRTVAVREKAVTIATELGGKALHSTEHWMLKYSEVPTTPFLSQDIFPWVKRVEENVGDVQAELDEVLSYRDDLPNFQDISVDQASISNDDGWKTFFFLGLVGQHPGLRDRVLLDLVAGKAHTSAPWPLARCPALPSRAQGPRAGVRLGDKGWR